MRCFVTVTRSMEKQLEENGLKVGYHEYENFAHPEVYSTVDLAMRFRCAGDEVLAEMEFDEEDVESYASGVFLVVKDITPSNIVRFQELEV